LSSEVLERLVARFVREIGLTPSTKSQEERAEQDHQPKAANVELQKPRCAGPRTERGVPSIERMMNMAYRSPPRLLSDRESEERHHDQSHLVGRAMWDATERYIRQMRALTRAQVRFATTA
jgi:hypothetical protein